MHIRPFNPLCDRVFSTESTVANWLPCQHNNLPGLALVDVHSPSLLLFCTSQPELQEVAKLEHCSSLVSSVRCFHFLHELGVATGVKPIAEWRPLQTTAFWVPGQQWLLPPHASSVPKSR